MRSRWIRYAVLSALLSQGRPEYQLLVKGAPYPSTYTSVFQFCRGYCRTLSPSLKREEIDKEIDRLYSIGILLRDTSGRYVRFTLA